MYIDFKKEIKFAKLIVSIAKKNHPSIITSCSHFEAFIKKLTDICINYKNL